MLKHTLFSLVFVLAAAGNALADGNITAVKGLILDLDADRGVTIKDGERVGSWRNQIADFAAQDFVQRDAGRKQPGSGRPTLRKSVKELRGHNTVVFRQQELVCMNEDAFDVLTQGGGCTWLAVLAVHAQRVGLKDVNSFFGNLRNGGNYEGLWACVSDDNRSWWGVRNGITFGRFDANNPQVHGTKMEMGQFTILAGRMAAGTSKVKLEIFHNHTNAAATAEVPVNPQGNPSKMAVGQEHDAVEHPGAESFDGEIARLLIFARPLEDAEMKSLFVSLRESYDIGVPEDKQNDSTPGDVAKPQVYTDWPFNAAEAARRQQETAKAFDQPIALKTPLAERDGPVLTWRLIPAGKFMMGSPREEPGHEGDERLHPETIAEPFYMLETQLTVEQYRALMSGDPTDGAKESDAKVPAGITYRDTVDKVLPALAKHAPAGWKVILPDQVRLEYAARAGVATMNPGGDKPEDAAPYAWTRENSERKMHPVAQKRPNAWGLHDVIGNRWHWFWRAGEGYGDASTSDHIVYGGTYHAESGGNGARLANIMISNKAEGARFALIRADAALPKGHPETSQKQK